MVGLPTRQAVKSPVRFAEFNFFVRLANLIQNKVSLVAFLTFSFAQVKSAVFDFVVPQVNTGIIFQVVIFLAN